MPMRCQNRVATASSEESVLTATALFKHFKTLSASLDTPPIDSKIIGWKTTPASAHLRAISPLAHFVLAYSSAAPHGSTEQVLLGKFYIRIQFYWAKS